MPIYVYQCPKCGCTQEHYRNISARLNKVLCLNDDVEMVLQIRSPAFNVPQAMKERLNENWAKREIKRKKGDLLT